MRARTTRIAAAAVALVAGAAFATLGGAGAAIAHNQVVASTPAEGEQLSALPAAFSITTNESMLDIGGESGGFVMDVVGPDGLHYADGCVTVVDDTMSTQPLLGPPGAYSLAYQLVSADGHTISGAIGFEWAGAGVAGVDAAVGTEAARACGDPAPEPTMTTMETPTEEPTDGDAAPAPSAEPSDDTAPASDVDLGTVLWIGGAVLAVLAAGGVTLLVLTRRRKD